MKVKQFLIMTDPNDFLRGEYNWTFSLFGAESTQDNHVNCGELEFEVNVDEKQVVSTVSKAIKQKIKDEIAEHAKRVVVLETRLNELLALEYDGAK